MGSDSQVMAEQVSAPAWARAILQRLEELQGRGRSIDDFGADDIITTAELAALLRLSEDSAREWAARWGVRASAQNRWPVHRVRLGLRREATQGGRKARRPGRAAGGRRDAA